MRRQAKAFVAVSALLLTLVLGVTFAGAVAPVVTIDPASDVSYTSAHFQGTVDPGEKETSYHFEYATQPDFSDAGFASFGGFPTGTTGPQPVEADPNELKPGTTYHLRLVASNEDGQAEAVAASTFTTDPVAPPVVTLVPVAGVTGTTAEFSGTIEPNTPAGDPEAFDVTYWFECTPQCPGLGQAQSAETIEADNSTAVVNVDADATGLDPNTDYEVRLVAQNKGGQSTDSENFKTEAVGPKAISLPVGPVTETTAIIGGWVDPNGSPTTYYVEYATQADFSDAISIPASEDESAGAGQTRVVAADHVIGLAPDSEYLYRVVAANGVDTDVSETQSFHTLAPMGPEPACPNAQFRTGPSADLSECRAYEKVTPVDKNGGDALFSHVYDGDHVILQASQAFLPEDPTAAPLMFYLGSRTASGWGMTAAVFGPQDTRFRDFSANFNQGVVSGTTPLTPDDTDGGTDVYLRRDGEFTRISQGPLGGNSGDSAAYAGQSADGAHVLFETPEHLHPEDAGRTSGEQLYELVGDELRVVGLDSAGNLIGDAGATLGTGVSCQGSGGSQNAISRDGQTIFFQAPGSCLNSDESELYARLNGEETLHLSASECDRVTPDPPCIDDGPVVFQGAADDGSVVYFSTPAQLLDSDLDQVNDLYSYDLDASELRRVTVLHDPDSQRCLAFGFKCDFSNVLEISTNGDRVAFYARGALKGVGDAPVEGLFLYDRKANETSLVGTMAPFGQEGDRTEFFPQTSLDRPPSRVDMTSDGGTIVFQTRARLTAFDNQLADEIYRYDLEADELVCVSCNSVGEAPLLIPEGAASTVPYTAAADVFYARLADIGPGAASKPSSLVSEDGRVVVFAAADSLVPEDVNEQVDIYEWHEGRARLLTLGTGLNNAFLGGMSPDGQSIFFSTGDRLLPSDIDIQSDLYTARVGGGLSADHPQAPVACAGESCRAGAATPPVDTSPRTPSFSGPGNLRKGKARCPKGKVRRRSRCVARKHRRHRQSRNNPNRRIGR